MTLESDLPPASCRILAIRPASTQPQVLGTSRHITQGVVDLLEEKWDSDTKTLQGASRVVANDPYELRIVAMGQEGPWRVADFVVSSVDSQPGASIKLVSQEDWRIRVRIDSPRSQDVRWSIRFAPAR
jgi:hypothetical protein